MATEASIHTNYINIPKSIGLHPLGQYRRLKKDLLCKTNPISEN